MIRNTLSVVVILLFIAVQSLLGQRAVNKSDIKDPVLYLIQDYKQKIGLVKQSVRPDPIPDVIALFTNSYVKVIDNLSRNPVSDEINIRNYCLNILNNFPNGIELSYNQEAVQFGKIEVERGNLYSIAVRLVIALNAFPGGLVYENKQLMEIRINFNWDGEIATMFRIAHIGKPVYNKQEFGIGFETGASRLTAPWMLDSDQVSQGLPMSYGSTLKYKYWIRPGFGVGTGIRWNYWSNQFNLDRFEEFGGKNPNISQIKMNTEFLFLQIPFFASWKKSFNEKLGIYFDLGLNLSYRYWGTFSSSGIQTNYNETIQEVMSYSEWDQDLAKVLVMSSFEGGMEIQLRPKLKYFMGIQGFMGMTPLDSGSDPSFEVLKFTGQYNPLWMSPDSRNFLQYAGIQFGLCYIFEPGDK